MTRLSRSGPREYVSRSPGLRILLLVVSMTVVLLLAGYAGLGPG